MIVCIIGTKSGCGKSSIVRELLKQNRHRYIPWLMYTTRPIRNNEINGIDYHFITDEELMKMDNEKLFIEKREYYRTDGAYTYATRILEPSRAKSGIYIFMEQTMESAQNVQDFYSKKKIPVLNFLIDASESVCIDRNIKRGGLAIEEIERRISSDNQLSWYPNLNITEKYINEYPEDLEKIVHSIKKRIDLSEMLL